MLGCVSDYTTIPVKLPNLQRQTGDRVAPCVFRYSARRIPDLQTGLSGAFAEVHILEPQRIEAFIKTSQSHPGFVPKQEESPRRLLDPSRHREVHIQTAITPIDGVARPQPV